LYSLLDEDIVFHDQNDLLADRKFTFLFFNLFLWASLGGKGFSGDLLALLVQVVVDIVELRDFPARVPHDLLHRLLQIFQSLVFVHAVERLVVQLGVHQAVVGPYAQWPLIPLLVVCVLTSSVT